ncbi:MAG: phenylalanine--tRNA ligase subunit beta [bacterium]
MKLSLSWIFDHIDADWQKQNVEEIVKRFNQVTAEIEDFYSVEFDLRNFALGSVTSFDKNSFTISIPEWKKEVKLPTQNISSYCLPEQKKLFFIMTLRQAQGELGNDKIGFATLQDFGVEKEGFLPPVSATDKDLDGSWKNRFEAKDIILDIDNKSITHRPDMWGHRGFAREIAAFMKLPFLPEDKFLNEKEVENFTKKTDSTDQNPISIEIDAPKACHRFSGIYFDLIENKPTDIFILSRLLKIGMRPINAIVDITNYLMFDWTQPTHAYDASKILGGTIIARMARKNEKLTLLDESVLKLSDKDLVIADTEKPLCLAGVMGGKDDSVVSTTTKLFLESANFDPVFVRRTAMRHGVRTESSSRFEKTLDPDQTTSAIKRFLNLLDKFNLKYNCADKIVSTGHRAEVLTLEVEHSFLEKRAGFSLTKEQVIEPLTRLCFTIQLSGHTERANASRMYKITVPTFRSSKDIEIKEDILEEVVRFYGFDNVEIKLPAFVRQAYDLTEIMRTRKVKHFFVNEAKMTEQRNYVYCDEQFLNQIGVELGSEFWEVINPVSENNRRLVTSLIPNLLKNINENVADSDSLYFFEVARIWKPDAINERGESKRLAGIFFEKRKTVDFYECKSHVVGMLRTIGVLHEQISFLKIDNPEEPWFMPYQTAKVLIDGEIIGVLGKTDPIFLSKLDVLPESDACIFDLDYNFLLNFEPKVKKFIPLPKYQETYIDFSVLVPLDSTVEHLQNLLRLSDSLVKKVELIDFFENPKWIDKRSLTFRVEISDPEKTMDKDQIDSIWNKCVEIMKNSGAQLRE